MNSTPTIQSLRDAFVLDIETGALVRRHSGSIAGFANGNGYRRLGFRRRQYYCHQVVWAIFNGSWPTGEVDHIDGDPSNNRPSNLRLTDRFGNTKNSRQRAHSKQPYKGVRKTRTGRWSARISSDSRTFHLGTFDSPEAAYAEYLKAAGELHGEYGRAS